MAHSGNWPSIGMAFAFICAQINRIKSGHHWLQLKPHKIIRIIFEYRYKLQMILNSISIIICVIRNLPAAENEMHDLAFTDRAKEVNVFLLLPFFSRLGLFFFYVYQLERILRDDNWRTVCLFYMHCMPHELSARCEVEIIFLEVIFSLSHMHISKLSSSHIIWVICTTYVRACLLVYVVFALNLKTAFDNVWSERRRKICSFRQWNGMRQMNSILIYEPGMFLFQWSAQRYSILCGLCLILIWLECIPLTKWPSS